MTAGFDATEWVESVTGGRLAAARRQARWRPAWFLDIETPDGPLPLYWRGDRGLPGSDQTLRREASVLRLLESEGVAVPHVHGLCPDPLGILMDRVPGEVDFHRADPAEQEAVAEHFLQVLAAVHAVDPRRVRDAGVSSMLPGPGAAGASSPGTSRAAEHALGAVAFWERTVRGLGPGVPRDPLLELALWWLHSRVPRGDVPTVLVHGDCGPGQFLFHDGRVSAVLDWEFCHLGDPMEDLALIRGRDLSYPFGDLRRRFARYGELSGHDVDLGRLRYYSVLAMLITPAGLKPVLADPPPGTDLAQVLAWNAVYSRALTQCLADASGIALDPVELPDAPPSARAWIHDAVVGALSGELLPEGASDYDRYRVRVVAQLADHLRRADRFGRAFDEAELEEAGSLLGRRPTSRADADRRLVALVDTAPEDRLEDLVVLLHRRAVRDESLLGAVLGELADTAQLRPIV